MKRLSTGLAGLAVLSIWAATGSAETTVPLTPGHYEVTVHGMPGGKVELRPRCVTAEHLADPEAVFTYAFQKKYRPLPNHKVMNFSAQGGKISYDVETPTSMRHVEGTLTSTTFSVDRTAKSTAGKGAPLDIKLVGKRTGDCKGQ